MKQYVEAIKKIINVIKIKWWFLLQEIVWELSVASLETNFLINKA